MSAPTQLQKNQPLVWCESTTNLSPATGIQMSLEMSIRSRRNRTTLRRSYRAYPGSCCVMLAHRFVLGMTKMYDDILSVQWFSSLFSFCNQELKKIKRQKELARKRGDVPWMEAKRLMGKSMGKSLRWVPHPRVWCPEVFLEDEDEWPCPERWNLTNVGSFCIASSPLLCYLFCNGMWKGVRIGGMLNQPWYRYFRFIENPSTPGNRKSHPLAARWSNKHLCKGWILHLNPEGWIITGSLIESNDLASNKNECLPGVQCFSMKHVKLTWHGASMEDLDRYHGKVIMESFMCSEKSSWLHNFEVYQSLRWEKLQEDVAKPMPEPVPQFFELRLKSTCHQPRA